MRMWEPNFKPSSAVCSLVTVWVWLPKLPFEYYELAILKEIGNAISPILRIDANTASETKGRYARICIQVDINMPMVRRILLEGVIQEVQYEGIYSLCFSCGRVGHRQETYLYMVQVSSPKQRQEEEGVQNKGEGSGTSRPASQIEANSDGGVNKEYRPWMLVRRKKVGPKVGKPCASVPFANHGSDLSTKVSREAHMPRANHHSPRSDFKSHCRPVDSKRKKVRRDLTDVALENGGNSSQGTASGAIGSPQDTPLNHSSDHSPSFTAGSGFLPSTSGLKISKNNSSEGEKLPGSSSVRKSSGKG
ncbi:uncharacterized protein LOC126696317 [Quercus robur]|uniref:uncharacterized protein LOC126696317 n=1 Tax=Quercus robur TaxID=38942 RepID=UPI0021629411|nr:uncharacterized protein LOC126696317 [Quercus robur]